MEVLVKRKKSKKISKVKNKPKSKIKLPSTSGNKKESPSISISKAKLWHKKPINKPDPQYLDKDRKKPDLDEWKLAPQKRFYNEYLKKGLIPFYRSTGRSLSNDLRPLDIFSDPKIIQEREWTAESVEKMKILIDKGIIEKSATSKKNFKSLSGNQIQTKVNYVNGKFSGLYYQNSKKLSALKEEIGDLPTCVKADFMRVDPDPIGMSQAWFLLEYVNPNMKLIDENGKEVPLDYNLAMRGLAGSIIDTKGFRRNLVVRNAIKDEKEGFGKSALVYLPKGAKPKDLSVSDQMVRACGLIVTRDVDIEVKTPDFTITYPKFEIRDFAEASPKLVFNVIPTPIVEPLDSDTLLQIGMQKLKMEAIVIQNLLEALYQQNWISYPRASITKADKEPIRIKNPETGKIYGKGEGREAEALVNDPEKGFLGTLHEKQLIDLIVKSQIANDQNKPFIMYGEWNLISGNLIERSKRKNYVHIVGEPLLYTADQIDIDIGARGIREEDLVAQLIEEDVATPSTRTAMLEELKSAGVMSRRADRIVVDRRGYYMAALDEYYINNSIERAYQLKNMLADASLEQMAGFVINFDWITAGDKRYNDILNYVKKRANKLLEAEQDLAYLEREGMPEQIE